MPSRQVALQDALPRRFLPVDPSPGPMDRFAGLGHRTHDEGDLARNPEPGRTHRAVADPSL